MPDSSVSSGLSLEQVKDLLAAFDASEAAELSLKQGDFKLRLRKPGAVAAPVVPFHTAPALTASPPSAIAAPAASATVAPHGDAGAARSLVVESPMVGVFYRSPAPESPPFVQVGDKVSAGQTVCIIEAMKLMNEIEAEHAGRVVKILVQNGEAVEYGQPLLEIQPD